MQPIFERVGDEFFPRVPRDLAGSVRQPDGVRWYSIPQAAAATGKTPAALLAQYTATFEGLLGQFPEPAPTEESPPLSSPPNAEVSMQHAESSDLIRNPQSAIPNSSMDVVRAIHHPELADADFDLLDRYCHQRNIPLYQVWTRRVWDDKLKRERLVILAKIELLRTIAHGTGLYAGGSMPIYDFGGKSPGAGVTPVSASGCVYRLVDGVPREFPATVFFHEFYGAPEGTDFRDTMPTAWLGKILEATLLRKAFSSEIGDLFIDEEFSGRRRGNAASDSAIRNPRSEIDRPRRDPTEGYDRDFIPAEIDENTPATWQQFEQWLKDRQVEPAERRGQLLEQYRREFQRQYQAHRHNPRQFFAELLEHVRRNAEVRMQNDESRRKIA